MESNSSGSTSVEAYRNLARDVLPVEAHHGVSQACFEATSVSVVGHWPTPARYNHSQAKPSTGQYLFDLLQAFTSEAFDFHHLLVGALHQVTNVENFGPPQTGRTPY